MASLARQLLGEVLRAERTRQGRTLREAPLAGGVSLGSPSEVERGQKEASSELLQSISQALGVPLSKVYAAVAQSFVEVESRREALAA